MQPFQLSDEELKEAEKTQILSDRDHPVYTRDIGNMTLICIQHWIGKTTPVHIAIVNQLRQGVEIYNNGNTKIYVGNTTDATLLKNVGRPVQPNTAFSTALYQGDIYAIADDTAGGNQDIRVWEEQL